MRHVTAVPECVAVARSLWASRPAAVSSASHDSSSTRSRRPQGRRRHQVGPARPRPEGRTPEPQGFDVDVAKYVIMELAGGQDVDIEWKESVSSNREAFLANGTVDIILAGYSITRRPQAEGDLRRARTSWPTRTRWSAPTRHGINKATDLDRQADLPGRRVHLLQAHHRSAAGRQARSDGPARRRGQLLRVRREAQRQQPGRGHVPTTSSSPVSPLKQEAASGSSATRSPTSSAASG